MEQSRWNFKIMFQKPQGILGLSVFPFSPLNVLKYIYKIKPESRLCLNQPQEMFQEPRTDALFLVLVLSHGVASHRVPNSRQGKSRGAPHLKEMERDGSIWVRDAVKCVCVLCVCACVCVYMNPCVSTCV